MKARAVLLAAGVLAIFGMAGAAIVAFTWEQTEERILDNERQALLQRLGELVPPDSVDNDMINDQVLVSDAELLGSEETRVYLGRREGQPVAAVFTSEAPNGYSGAIKLLVAVRAAGSLGGVRVVAHHETPGLGDKIELEKSDWILDFNGKSLDNPVEALWRVRKDGGVFDQFTGATITPRILVAAVKKTLLYYRKVGQALFTAPPAPPSGASG